MATLNSRQTTLNCVNLPFSTWCPKAIAAIGRLPDTLADRSIVIRMQRKAPAEPCERLRNLNPANLRRCCARFVLDHRSDIAAAQPALPPALNDRAADIWEPLFALADLAGGDWPNLARQAAEALSAPAPESSPVSSLFLDILIQFVSTKASSLFSRSLVENLNQLSDRPWSCLRNGHLSERWLADRLREYDIRPRLIRIGQTVARGYLHDDFRQAFKRYISPADLDALRSTLPDPPAPVPSNPSPSDLS